MFKVIANTQLSPNVWRLDVMAPRIAQIRQAGQFVIVCKGENCERVPLTIADASPKEGWISLVIQAIGKSTRQLVALQAGEFIRDISGPLGKPTELAAPGQKAVCVGGGVGTGVVHPIAQGLHAKGVKVVSVIGGRSKPWVFFEQELKRYGEVVVCTDDGSYGRKGFVTDAMKDKAYDYAFACGPAPMLKAVYDIVPDGQFSFEARMACGFGACMGCTMETVTGYKRVCKDGPIFYKEEIKWQI